MTPSQPRFAAARPINQFLRCGVGEQVWFCQPIFQASPTLWITAEKRITFRDLVPDLAVTCRRNRLERLWGGCPELAHLVRNVRRTARPGAHVGVRRQVPRGFPVSCCRGGPLRAAVTGGVQPLLPAAGLPIRLRPGPTRRRSWACAAARPGPPKGHRTRRSGLRRRSRAPSAASGCKFVLGGARGLEQGGGPR